MITLKLTREEMDAIWSSLITFELDGVYDDLGEFQLTRTGKKERRILGQIDKKIHDQINYKYHLVGDGEDK